MAAVPALKRTIRFRDLFLFYVVSGLSVRWTAMAAAAGPSILLVWIAALFCFFVPLAASVMELSSRFPEEGGLYIWTREAFGDASGFISAWTYLMSNLPYFPGVLYFGAASTLFAFGGGARSLATDPLYFISFSVAWLGIITFINIRGLNLGKWLNNLCAIGAVLPLIALVSLAVIAYFRFGSANQFSMASLTPHFTLGNAVFWSSVFFAFGGVEAGSAMGDEIENPRRIIPWAILLGGGVLALGYIGGTTALLIALPSSAVAGPDGFINGVALLSSRLHVEWLIAPVALLVGLNSVGGAAAYLSSTSRLPFVAGIDHYLPPAFGKVHTRYRTPYVAIGLYGLAGVIVALASQAGTTVRGAYDVLVSMAIIAYFIPYLMLFGAMIRLQSRPAGPEVRRVPGGKPVAIMLAIIGIISTSATIVLSVIPSADEPNKPLAVLKVVGGSGILIGAGVLIFLIGRMRMRRALQDIAVKG
ncbi:APC family permease [Occallatibacter riparius]|uniref:APC family permease n=1 Tax=Occallatibacter riparius TaxID=1002689 RepID=A0A9J7BI67_9BACT|nr:APC family permease [Occallatibacter riparius]UWZ82193.1 APC family permease [Occallatibacter riparius]